MSQFQVPEPSYKAIAEYHRAAFPPAVSVSPSGLHAAYAVDVPGIVRVEVEKALVGVSGVGSRPPNRFGGFWWRGGWSLRW